VPNAILKLVLFVGRLCPPVGRSHPGFTLPAGASHTLGLFIVRNTREVLPFEQTLRGVLDARAARPKNPQPIGGAIMSLLPSSCRIGALSAVLLAALALTVLSDSAHAGQLLGFYTFEGASPAAFDDVSGQGLNPTSPGTATLNAAGYEGQAAEFVGSTALSLPLDINTTVHPVLTIGAWVKADSLYDRGLFGNDNGGWDRGLDLRGGTWRVTSGPYADVNSGIAGSTTNWQFVALTYNSPTSATLYVDNNPAFRPAGHAPGAGATNMVIGAYTVASVHPFDGLVDNFFIFDQRLNQGMIAEIRSGKAAGVRRVQRMLNTTVIDDSFDDTDGDQITRIGWNHNGIGGGFQYQASGSVGTTGENVSSAAGTGFLSHSAGNWAQSGVTSNDVVQVLNTAANTETMWSTRRVYVDADQSTYLPQAVGGETSDWRFQHGIISTDRANTSRNDLYANGEGGLYINLFYERETSYTDLTLKGNIRAATKDKGASQDQESATGLVTLATFDFGSVLGGNDGQHLTVMLDTDNDGWAFRFADDTGFLTPTVTAGSLSGGWTNLTSIVDAETVSFTDEFLNGAFVFSEGAALSTGRGSGVLDQVFVSVGVPEPATAGLLMLGGLGLLGCGWRRRSGGTGPQKP